MPLPGTSSAGRGLLLLTGALLCAACETHTADPQPLHPGDIRTFVSPDVAAQLTSAGTFPLSAAAPEPYPQITRETAAVIALAWARTYGRYFRPTLERSHGRRIDFDALTVVSPGWYAAAVYAAAPPGAHPGIRNAFGPHYILYLGVGGEPVLGVSVAAFAESYIDEEGLLADPPQSGSEVIAYGVPPGWGYSMPVSAEQAARIAATATRARVAAVPELINPHRDYHPYHARWKVSLERAVAVQTRSGASRRFNEIYVGAHGEVLVPADTQEDTAGSFPLSGGGRFGLRRRPDRPVSFVSANPVPE